MTEVTSLAIRNIAFNYTYLRNITAGINPQLPVVNNPFFPNAARHRTTFYWKINNN